jgi:ABC-2 type transport system permease protein
MTHLYWVALKSIWAKEINRFMRIWVQTLVPPVITMTLYFIIFGNLIGSRIGEMHGFTYMQFIVPGLIMMAVITNAYANVASSFFSAKFQRNIEELLVAPVPTHVIIAGYVGGGVARGLCVGILVTAISLFFVPFQVHSWLFVALTLLLTAILFSLAGLLNAVFAKTFDDISLIPTFVLTPLTYLGGVFYSLTLLPPFWQALSHLNPIVYMISGFRFGFLGITDVPLFTTVAVLVVFIIAFYLLCWYLIQRGAAQLTFCPATFRMPGAFFDSYHRKLTFTPLNYSPAKESYAGMGHHLPR